MKITLHPYRLEFVFPFRIAHGVRTHTDAVFVELELDGFRAFGEATLPPYLRYTQESTIANISKVDFSKITFPYKTNELLPSLGIMPSTMEAPAMAAIDMALWTLEAKMKGITVRDLLGIDTPDTAIRTYTISVCDKAEMADRIAYGKELGFTAFKLKLNGTDDKRIIDDFRCLSDAPFAVDANQSQDNWNEYLALTEELRQKGCMLIEEPFSKEFWEHHTMELLRYHRIKKNTVGIPVIADESCQNFNDIKYALYHYHASGINIKLQKCGGLFQAIRMVKRAKENGMKILIGCMSESSIGCDAAEAISPLCDWNDLDGKYLVKEVPFKN